jgi:hypothetical protein
MDLSGVGKMLLAAAVLLAVLGVTFLLIGRGILPRLPGNFSFGRGNVRVFVPLGTSIVLSILLTVVLNLLFRR